MLTQEDLQLIRNLIAQSQGPDRTGSSGLSRKSLKDAIRKADLRNPRRLDTHYVILEQILLVDDLVALNPYLPIAAPYNPMPSVLGLLPSGNEFITCEPGTTECVAIMLGEFVAAVPSLFVEIYVNNVSVASTTTSLVANTPVILPFNVDYSAGDRLAVAITNTGPLDVAEVFLEATLLRKERFVG